MKAKKRDIFGELMEGVQAMKDHREGKITLRTHRVEAPEPLELTGEEIRETRDSLHLSRRVFARTLRINERTLENWEQGRAVPNQQAAALIYLVRDNPGIVQQLQTIGKGLKRPARTRRVRARKSVSRTRVQKVATRAKRASK